MARGRGGSCQPPAAAIEILQWLKTRTKKVQPPPKSKPNYLVPIAFPWMPPIPAQKLKCWKAIQGGADTAGGEGGGLWLCKLGDQLTVI